jgi:hypothetical protein
VTIALSVKTRDAVVLAADSAATQISLVGTSQLVDNIYYNAVKVFNLCRGLPVGAVAYGTGTVGTVSTENLVKDFRLASADPSSEFALDPQTYSIGDIAERLRRFVGGRQRIAFRSENYGAAFRRDEERKVPALGFLVSGYGATTDHPEEWEVVVRASGSGRAKMSRGQDSEGITAKGLSEPSTRIMYSEALPEILRKRLSLSDDVVRVLVQTIAQGGDENPLLSPTMPIQDAIDLADFLVDTTIRWNRFSIGKFKTVGGPVDIAAITKHEGFRWIKRKHYYDRVLN